MTGKLQPYLPYILPRATRCSARGSIVHDASILVSGQQPAGQRPIEFGQNRIAPRRAQKHPATLRPSLFFPITQRGQKPYGPEADTRHHRTHRAAGLLRHRSGPQPALNYDRHCSCSSTSTAISTRWSPTMSGDDLFAREIKFTENGIRLPLRQ